MHITIYIRTLSTLHTDTVYNAGVVLYQGEADNMPPIYDGVVSLLKAACPDCENFDRTLPGIGRIFSNYMRPHALQIGINIEYLRTIKGALA